MSSEIGTLLPRGWPGWKRVNQPAVWMCLIFGTLLSATVSYWGGTTVYQAERQRIEVASYNTSSAIAREIEEAVQSITALHAFAMNSDEVTEQEFIDFVRAINRNPTHKNWQFFWLPRVTRQERTQFEAKVAKRHPGFQIIEAAGDGKYERAPEREIYFPITYVGDHGGTATPMGLSASKVSGAMAWALRSGELVTTPARQAHEDPDGVLSVTFYWAIYDRTEFGTGLGTPKGVLAACIRVKDLVEGALYYLQPQGLDITIREASSPSVRAMYTHLSREVGAEVVRDKQPLEFVRQIEVGSRKWNITCSPAPGVMRTGVPLGLISFSVMMACTLLLAGYLITLTGHAARTRATVRARTRSLREANQAAMAASKAKSLFLANVSHEVLTPLNGVIGSAELLSATPLSAEQREHADTIRESAGSLLRILDDILDMAKLERGLLTITLERVMPARLCERLKSVYKSAADEKQLQLEVSVAEEVPAEIEADGTRLLQILGNFLSNAIKFTAAGFVRLEVKVVCPVREERVTLRFSVVDSGVGIPAEARGRIFEMFSQADDSHTREFGGLGLGLAICRQIAGAMGGTVGVEKRAEGGSEFWFECAFSVQKPAMAAESSTLALARAVEQPKADRKILVVEDNPVNQKISQAILSQLGYEVEIAENGRAAVDMSANHHYGLILMDCQMPVLDGYGATVEIRNREAGGRRTPIVALTAHVLPQDRQRCLDAGMDDYLPKPIVLRDLARTLERWMAPASRVLTS